LRCHELSRIFCYGALPLWQNGKPALFALPRGTGACGKQGAACPSIWKAAENGLRNAPIKRRQRGSFGKRMEIQLIAHKHANMYLIGANGFYALFDCGWQDSFPAIKEALRERSVDFAQIKGAFASHFHPDHAGTLELLRRHGVRPLVLERQAPHIDWLNKFFAQKKNDPKGDYFPLDPGALTLYTPEEAQSFLEGLGIGAAVLYTPGHSDDSISLAVGAVAFVGDMQRYESAESWKALRECGARMAYPAHGAAFEI
jgi:hypothetical protein